MTSSSKMAPEAARLDAILRSSRLVRGGFMGPDRRPVDEVIAADAAVLARLDRTAAEIAQRMRAIMQLADEGLGTPVNVGDKLEARVTDSRGRISCPWPHAGHYDKTVVFVRRTDTGESIRWSALNVHLIEAHGFFEGRGSSFRLDPRKLAEMILEP